MCGEMVHLPTHAWEEQVVAIPCTFLLAPPHTRMGRTSPTFHDAHRKSTSPHTHGKNPDPDPDPDPDPAPPHTRMGRTVVSRSATIARSTSPHTRGKNNTSPSKRRGRLHLPTHAWEEPRISTHRTQGPPPPHTRMGRTPAGSAGVNSFPTSPHTRGKNPSSPENGGARHLPTHAWEELRMSRRRHRRGTPPHTRVGRTWISPLLEPSRSTSPHTRGKNDC